MANKTYYEQNYPTTKYEYSSRGYRNERMHSGDSRKMKKQYMEASAANPDYFYYENFQDEQYEKDGEGEDQWDNVPDCCIQKQKSAFHDPCKRSSKCQPVVNTPRYYRNMAHRRPSALCIPVLAQPESSVRRKSKSQCRVEGVERVEKEQKNFRYRVRQPRHHLLPPPPTLPHYAHQPAEQTDFETSSGDGRRSLQSQTQSSGSLSVDISSQVESLNQSFNAVTKERRGKKIIYGDVEPVYTNVESAYNNQHMKARKPHRRHSRRHKHSEPSVNWAAELCDLPEENQDQEWMDKVETDWTNLEQQHNSCSHVTNVVDYPLRKSRSKKHQQHHALSPHHYMSQQQVQQPPSPQHAHSVPSKLLNPSLPRPRTRGSHASSKDSQEPPVSDAPKANEKAPKALSVKEDKTDKLNFLENLFSEVFAQGCVDNLSKRTRLDFIKEAYDKYSASFEESDKVNNHEPQESGPLHNPEPFSSDKPQGAVGQWNDEFIDQSEVENRQISTFALSFESTNSQPGNNTSNKTNNSMSSDSQYNKNDKSVKSNNNEVFPNSNDIHQKGVANFLLSVKPRRRSMKIKDTEGPEKDSFLSTSRFPDQEKDSIPRFPNLIENMSARYIGSSNIKKPQLVHPQNSSNQHNLKNPLAVSNSSNSSPVQKQPSKEYAFVNHASGAFDSTIQLQKGPDMNCGLQSYGRTDSMYVNQGDSQCQFSTDSMNQFPNNNNYERERKSFLSQPHNTESVHYSNSNSINYFDRNYSNQHNENCSCSVTGDINKLNTNNFCNSKEDYASNLESNYLTIKRCEEILNQVKENFGENVMKNPDVFQTSDQYETDINDQATYTVGGSDYHNNSLSFKENIISESIISEGGECATLKHENEIGFAHSPGYYEKPPLSELCSGTCQYQGESHQNYSKADNFKSHESRHDAGNEDFQEQNVQANYYLHEERQNFHGHSDYFEATTNAKVRSNESKMNEEHSRINQEISSYESIDQDKVKQFIHTLTGFDAVQRRETSPTRGMSRCSGEYQNNSPKNDFNQYNSPDTYSNAVSHEVSVSDKHYSSEKYPHHQSTQPFQQQPSLHSSRSKCLEEGKLERRQHYSIPQRKEIERMKQDSLSVDNISYNREKLEPQMTYRDFPTEVPNRNTLTPQEMTFTETAETENPDIFKLRKARNKMNLVGNENYQKSDNVKERFHPHVESETSNYPYEYNYSTVNERRDNTNFLHNQGIYFKGSVSGTAANISPQDGSQINNKSNCGINGNKDTSEIDFSKIPNQFCDHEHHYHVADRNDQQYLDDNETYTVNDINSPSCHNNSDSDFAPFNETVGFENEFPADNNSEDAKAAMVKRKYYFMPSENYEDNTEKYGEGSISDQSTYKSYIENLIDNSLQTSGNEQSVKPQNIKQGPILQSQGDVVELETDKAIDLVMNESSCQMDSKLCLEITQRLTDTLVQSHKDIPTPCLVALEEPVYLQQLKKLRWDHLRHIEREVKRLESLERFLDTCGCGHMMYTKNDS